MRMECFGLLCVLLVGCAAKVPPPDPPAQPAPTQALPPAPPAKGSKEAGLAVLVAKCAGCHAPGTPNFEDLALLDAKGNLLPLTPQEKLLALKRVKDGKMPPPKNRLGIPPVTEAEKADVAEIFK